MGGILAFVQVVMTLVPQLTAFEGQAEAGINAGVELYKKLQGLFGTDILPDKTDAEIAAMGAQTWDELAATIAAEKARLAAEATPPPPGA